MAKDSRPDIQVLEDRIVRLKSQLAEYKKIRLYSSTKRRLSVVATELADCITTINEIIGDSGNVIKSSSISAINPAVDDSQSSIPEFTEDSDILDTFLLRYQGDSESRPSPYSAKEIVSTYCKRLKEGSMGEGAETGILIVNQFWRLLNAWYQARFTPSVRNPKFHFKADKIHEWIDLLMIAAGRALHEKLFSRFLDEVYDWINTLNTEKDETWVLPYCVMQFRSCDKSCCTAEAVMFETMVKSSLYDSSFYPDEKHSVRSIVINNGGFKDSDLTLDRIIRDCPTSIFRTSLFDITKYEEV